MKSNKKLISVFLTVAIVALATIGFTGCNGTVSVNPVDNNKLITRVRTYTWKENAERYDDCVFNAPNVSISELTGGSPTARYNEIFMDIATNVFDGYEFFQVNVDIMADRDVTATIGLYYGGGNEANLRHSVTLELKANEVSHQEWSLSKNFVTYNGDTSKIVSIRFDNKPVSGTEAFKEWAQAQYTFSNLEFYAVAPENK